MNKRIKKEKPVPTKLFCFASFRIFLLAIAFHTNDQTMSCSLNWRVLARRRMTMNDCIRGHMLVNVHCAVHYHGVKHSAMTGDDHKGLCYRLAVPIW